MEKIRLLIAEIQSRFQQLSERERRLVLGAAGALGAVLLLVLLFSFASSANGYRRRTEDKLRKLAEAQILAENYRKDELEKGSIERMLSANNVSLITYVEEKGSEAGLQIPSMNPKGDIPLGDGKIVESAIEVQLNDTTITKLVNFLSSVERDRPGIVKVKYLRVEPRPSNQTLTAWVTISAYRLKQ
jgi:general secretion pathway protein M